MKTALAIFFEIIILTQTNAIDQYIVNGTDATIEEFPFLVSLRKNNAHSCGASIIDESWLLTAAHCVQSSASGYTVQFASTYLDPNSTNVAHVDAFYPHEGYNPSDRYINDIALVKLSSPIVNNIFEWKVKLPTKGASYLTGTPAVLTGWGKNSTNGPIQTTLQKVNLQIYSASDCNKTHGGVIHPTNICAGVEDGYMGQSRDSGGPILVKGVQVGIVSWSIKPCTIPPYPGVYTAVAPYIDWIKQRTGLNLSLHIYLQA